MRGRHENEKKNAGSSRLKRGPRISFVFHRGSAYFLNNVSTRSSRRGFLAACRRCIRVLTPSSEPRAVYSHHAGGWWSHWLRHFSEARGHGRSTWLARAVAIRLGPGGSDHHVWRADQCRNLRADYRNRWAVCLLRENVRKVLRVALRLVRFFGHPNRFHSRSRLCLRGI